MTVTAKMTKAVLKRDGYRCVIATADCTGEATIADHRANRGHGGSKVLDFMENLIAACGVCNGLKEDAVGAHKTQLIERGIRVKKRATNAQTVERVLAIPVLYADGWYQLVGVERVSINAHTAVEYLVLIGVITTGKGWAY